jgi:hypothetical protein
MKSASVGNRQVGKLALHDLTHRQRAQQAFRAFAREFGLEQAVHSARNSVQMPEADWDQLAEPMADIAVELQAAVSWPASIVAISRGRTSVR